MDRLVGALRDWWVPLVLVAVAVQEGRAAPDPSTLQSLVLVGLALATLRRRQLPLHVAVTIAVLACVQVFFVQEDPGQQGPLTAFLAILVSLFALGVHGSARRVVPSAVTVGVLLGAIQVAGLIGGQRLEDVFPSSLFMVGAYGIGRLIRHSRHEACAERERARRLEEERVAHVAQATAAERTRIARELHDVVAHSLSLIVVQASVEARLMPDGQSQAAATLRGIEHQGRAALVELRRLLGLLREDPTELRPLPRLAQVEDVVDHVRRAGHEVRLDVCGPGRELPAGVDLAGYRIIQEALTNVTRHAPGAPVEVRLRHQDDNLAVEVVNGPSQAPCRGTPPTGGGYGLAGMRERVRVYGGELEAGPQPDGGFRVRATIPAAAE